MLENDSAELRNIENREDGDEACHDRTEEKLVPPDVVHPLREVFLRVWLHSEERSAEVLSPSQHSDCK